MPPKLNVPRLFWGGSSVKMKIIEDDTWSLCLTHQSPDRSEITIKVGNKEYALSSITDSQEKKSKITEAGIYKKYRYEIGCLGQAFVELD
jgi:hypothetical protein